MENTTQANKTERDLQKLSEAITSLIDIKDGNKTSIANYARKKLDEIGSRDLTPEDKNTLEGLKTAMESHGYKERSANPSGRHGKIISEEKNRGWSKV